MTSEFYGDPGRYSLRDRSLLQVFVVAVEAGDPFVLARNVPSTADAQNVAADFGGPPFDPAPFNREDTLRASLDAHFASLESR